MTQLLITSSTTKHPNFVFDDVIHEARLNDKIIPTVSQVILDCGLSRAYVDNKVNFMARQFGKAVHYATALDDHQNLGSCDELLMPYVESWRQFKIDFNLQFQIIEQRLVSETRLFCGQPDRGFVLNWKGRNVIVDLKSGAVEKSHQYQTAGYELLITEDYQIKIHERWSVYLRPNKYFIESHTNKNNRNAFLAALLIWHEKRSYAHG